MTAPIQEEQLLYESPSIGVYEARSRQGDAVICLRVRQERVSAAVNPILQPRGLADDLTRELLLPLRELDTAESPAYALLEREAGLPAREFLDSRPSPAQCFDFAGSLLRALAGIHRRQIILTELHPRLLWYHPDSGTVRFLHLAFSSPSNFSRAGVGFHTGSLQYIAPEQTGRIPLRPDYRSNYYSVGLILYELFTGEHPLAGKDTLEWVHQHLARKPDPAFGRRPEVGRALSSWLDKLLAKDPDDRYQSIQGMENDLRAARSYWEEGRLAESLPLGTQDFPETFLIPDQLVGREDDLEALQQRIAGWENGKVLLFLDGEEGVGKSALLQQWEYRSREELRWVFGRHQSDSRTPFEAFRQIVTGLREELFTLAPGERTRVQQELAERTRNLSGVLIRFAPELAGILPHGNGLVALDGSASFSRFVYAMSQFLRAFTSPRRPLVLVLENLDLAEPSTFRLLDGLLADPELQHLVLIGTFRTRSAYPAAFSAFRTSSRKFAAERSRLRLEEFTLHNLGPEGVSGLLDRVSPEDRGRASDLIWHKTGGNPLFIRQLLHDLVNAGAFYRDPGAAHWRVRLELLSQLPATRNMVSLMEHRLEGLPQREQQLLRLAAAVGETFDPDLLVELSGESPERCYRMLSGLETTSLIFQSPSPGPFGAYRFSHERLVDRFRKGLPAEERQALMGPILRYYQNRLEEQVWEDNLFRLAAFAVGAPAEERANWTELLQAAAAKATQQSAFDNALTYLQRLVEALPANAWAEDRKRTLALHFQAVQTAIFALEYARAERWLAELEDRLEDQPERTEWYYQRCLSLVNQGKMKETVECALAGLRELGVKFTMEPPLWRIIWGMVNMDRLYKGKNRSDIDQLPDNRDPRSEQYNRLIIVASPAIYFAAPKLLGLIAELRMKDTFRSGKSPYTPSTLVSYGFLTASFTPKVPLGYDAARLGMDLNAEYGLRELEPPNRFLFGTFVAHAREPLRRVGEELVDNFRACRELGNNNIGFYSLGVGLHYLLYSGASFERLRELGEHYLPVCEDAGQEMIGEYVRQLLQWCHELEAEQFSDQLFQGPHLQVPPGAMLQEIDTRKNSDTTLRGLFVALSYLKGDYEAIHPVGEVILRYNAERGHNTVHANFNVFFILAARLKDEGYAGKLNKRSFRKHFRKLEHWGKSAPEHYGVLFGLLSALWQDFRAKEKEAGEAFREAYDRALSADNPLLKALAAEEWGTYLYVKRGEKAFGQTLLREAGGHFSEWGAQAKLQQLIDRFPGLRQPLGEGGGSGQSIDLESVLKASGTISSEIRQQPLMDRLLGLVVENAGAERGAFVVPEGEGLVLLAAKEAGAPAEFIQLPLEPKALPERILRYVAEEGKPLVVPHAAADRKFNEDPYVRAKGLRSVLCFPLLRNEELKALIYLENNLAPNLFSEERVELLRMLSSQMAISLENAQLYDQLEEKVAERTRELNREKERSDVLLRNILPEQVARELKERGRTRAVRYERVSVLFTDFRDFTLTASQLSAEALVDLLDRYFTEFDRIIDEYRLEKIKTIGDAYMCAGGIPEPEADHYERTLRAALAIRDFVALQKEEREASGAPFFEVRLGVHIGPVVAGIVGKRKFAYDIWGETVNLASRMESNGAPGRINVSEDLYELAREKFEWAPHGQLEGKDGTRTRMYWLESGKG